MEDVLTEAPPPSRLYQEDLDIFVSPSPPLPAPVILLSPNRPLNPNPAADLLLVIAISSTSLSLLPSPCTETLAAALFLPEIPLSPLRPSAFPSPSSLSVFTPRPNVAFASAGRIPIPADRTLAVTKTLLTSIPAKEVLILDTIRFSGYRGRLSPDETVAFKLETSAVRKNGNGLMALRDVEYLPSGSLADGLGAALMVECEMRRMKAAMLLTWPVNGTISEFPPLLELAKELGLNAIEPSVGLKRSLHSDMELYI